MSDRTPLVVADNPPIAGGDNPGIDSTEALSKAITAELSGRPLDDGGAIPAKPDGGHVPSTPTGEDDPLNFPAQGQEDNRNAGEEPDLVEEGAWPQKAVDVTTRLRAERRKLREESLDLKRQLNASEERVQELSAQVEANAQPTAVATREDPLGFITTPAELDAYHQGVFKRAQQIERLQADILPPAQLEDLKEYLKSNGAWDEEADSFDPRALKELQLLAQETLSTHIPRKDKMLGQEAQFNAQAEQVWPWWNQKSSREYKIAQSMLMKFPQIRSEPHWKGILGIYVMGLQAFEKSRRNNGQTQAEPTPGSRRPAPRLPTAPAALPSAPRASEFDAARQRAFGDTRKATTRDVRDYAKAALLGG